MHSYIEQIGDIKNKNNEREGYMEFLDTSGFKFGAATYWNADITMFLSKTGIELKPANSATDLNMFEWNTKKSYQNRKPEFFLLTKDEYEERVKAGLVDKILYIDNAYVIVTSDTF